jgi:hypothetical protein
MAKDLPPIAGWPTQTSFVHEGKVRVKKGNRYLRGSRKRHTRRQKGDLSPPPSSGE